MPSIIRPHLTIIPALILAFGCTSTSAPEPTDERSIPLTESESSNTPVSEMSAALTPIYFDTDLAVLRPEARNALKQFADSILDHPEWGVLKIDGHCDERGSDEHNLRLGERRATAVERYLVNAGVPSSRLSTRTFGDRRPAVRGHDEGAWRRNRRAELHVEHEIASN